MPPAVYRPKIAREKIASECYLFTNGKKGSFWAHSQAVAHISPKLYQWCHEYAASPKDRGGSRKVILRCSPYALRQLKNALQGKYVCLDKKHKRELEELGERYDIKCFQFGKKLKDYLALLREVVERCRQNPVAIFCATCNSLAVKYLLENQRYLASYLPLLANYCEDNPLHPPGHFGAAFLAKGALGAAAVIENSKNIFSKSLADSISMDWYLKLNKLLQPKLIPKSRPKASILLQKERHLIPKNFNVWNGLAKGIHYEDEAAGNTPQRTAQRLSELKNIAIICQQLIKQTSQDTFGSRSQVSSD